MTMRTTGTTAPVTGTNGLDTRVRTRRRLASNQADLYIADQAAEDSTAYHAAMVYRVTGRIDEAALAERFDRLLLVHPMLASRVVEEQDGWFFEPAEHTPALHVATVPVDPDGERARRRVRNECLRPLGPGRGPMVRAVLLRYRADIADLIVVAHHLVVDEPSFAVLADWLLAGREVTPAHSYEEWADASHDLSPARSERAATLREELGSADLSPSLGWADGQSGTTGAGLTEARLPAELWEGIRRLSAEMRITPYSFVLGAAGLVLGRNSRAARPVIGATVSRRSPRYAATIGYFNSTVLLPVDLAGDSSVAGFLQAVHSRSVRAYRDADLPLSTVLPESSGGAPHLVVVPSAPMPEPTTVSSRCVPRLDIDLGTAQFPLALYLHQEPHGGVRGLLRFQYGAVSASAAERFCRALETVLTGFVADPAAALDDVDTVAPEDARHLLALGSGSDTEADVPAG
ncbi:condensation domain-containing protein, partial [Streptomyces sp. NPDC002742]|uniref:condensation domain-containing protein n=1 Tax=Streptomyces sp. NPDC002742 TaxID=3364663 RepID=UPI00368D057A